MYKVVFILLLLVSTSFSQEKALLWSGFLKNNFSATKGDSINFSNTTKMRLEGTYQTENSKVETALEFSKSFAPLDPTASMRSGSKMSGLYSVLVASLLNSSLDDSTLMQVNNFMFMYGDTINFIMSNLPYSTLYVTDNLLIDRAALSFYAPFADFTIGIQQIAWGVGYAFNPTDIWNKKNPSDPTALKSGVPAMRAQFPLGQLSGLDLVIIPSSDFATTSEGLRFKSNAMNFDYSFSLSRYYGVDRRIMLLPEKMIAGFDLSGDIVFDIGFWTEIAAVNPRYSGLDYTDTDSLYVQADVGVTYTFETGITVMTEYYFNGLGNASRDNYSTADLMKMINGDMIGMGKHYLMAMAQYTIFDDYNLSAMSLINITDNSLMLIPQVEYSFNEDLSLTLSTTLGLGDYKYTEYGSVCNSASFNVSGWF